MDERTRQIILARRIRAAAIAIPIALVSSAILALGYDVWVAPGFNAIGLNFEASRDIPHEDQALFVTGVVAASLAALLVAPLGFRRARYPTIRMALATYTIGVVIVPVASVLQVDSRMDVTGTLVVFYCLSPFVYFSGLPVLAGLLVPASLWTWFVRQTEAGPQGSKDQPDTAMYSPGGGPTQPGPLDVSSKRRTERPTVRTTFALSLAAVLVALGAYAIEPSAVTFVLVMLTAFGPPVVLSVGKRWRR